MKYLAIIICFLSIITSLYADDVSVEFTHPQMQNECVDGFIDLQITGGYAPFSVEYEKFFKHEEFGCFWLTVKEVHGINGTDGSEDLEDAVEGKYRITITDFHCGKVKTGAELVCECNPCEINASIQEPSCLGNDGGAISLQMECEGEDQGLYIAKWGDGVSGLSRSGLTAGRYCVTVQDRNECESSNCWLLGVEGSVSINLTEKNNPTFCGSGSSFCDGSLGVTANGGNAPYHYRWSNGTSGPSNSDLCAGTYTVTVTDREGCRAEQSFTICCCEPWENQEWSAEDACSLSNDIFQMEYEVGGLPNGFINISLTGGVGSYSCNWSGGSGYTNNGCTGISNITAIGTYCFEATDGCSIVRKCFRIVNCSESDLSLSGISIPTCPDLNAGSISLSISGGDPPYYPRWDTGSGSTSLDELFAGTYCVTVTDNTFCAVEACFEVDETGEVSSTEETIVPCQNISYCNGIGVVTDEADYSDSHTEGICVVDRYCPVNDLTEEVTLNSILIMTVGCVRFYRCADGNEEQLQGTGIGNNQLYPKEDNTCSTGYRCHQNPCEYTDENDVTEYYFNDNIPPSSAGDCTFITYGNCGADGCSPNEKLATFYCGVDNIVNTECVDCEGGSLQTPDQSENRSIKYNNSVLKSTNRATVKYSKIIFSPNPFTHNASISFFNNSNEANNEATAKVYDLHGRMIFNRSLNINIGSNYYELDLNSILEGVYVLKLSIDSKEVYSKKIVRIKS